MSTTRKIKPDLEIIGGGRETKNDSNRVTASKRSARVTASQNTDKVTASQNTARVTASQNTDKVTASQNTDKVTASQNTDKVTASQKKKVATSRATVDKKANTQLINTATKVNEEKKITLKLQTYAKKEPICNKLEKIDVVVGDNAYVEIKNECKGTGYGFETYMPILHITNSATNDNALKNSDVSGSEASEDTLMNNSVLEYSSENISSSSVNEGPVRVGLKADVTIVKVRKTAWLTLANALVNYAKELETPETPITATGIYKNKQNDKVITLFVQAGQGDKIYKPIYKVYNLCELGKVFEGANVDEAEEHMSGGAGLIRKTMADNNSDMKNVDEAMFEIISILFLLMNIKSGKTSTDAKEIIQAFIATSSAKEYLDTGQLYAICGPTIKLNEKRGYKADQILVRCDRYFSNLVTEEMDIPKGGMNNGKNVGYNYDSDSDASHNSHNSRASDATINSVSTINSVNQLRTEYRNNPELLASLQKFKEEENEKKSLSRSRALIGNRNPAVAVTPTPTLINSLPATVTGYTPDNSLPATLRGYSEYNSPPATLRGYSEDNSLVANLIEDGRSSEVPTNRKLEDDYDKSDNASEQTKFNNEANEDENKADIANSFEDENNADITNSNEVNDVASSSSSIQLDELPHKPMLETIDGAATSIASNQYFTSYCACKLNGRNKKSENACFVIDNNDVFLLTIWFSKDANVNEKLVIKLKEYHQQNLTKHPIDEINKKFIENDDEIEELIKQLKSPNLIEELKIQKQEELNKLTKTNTVKKIDICYYILQNYRDLLESTREQVKKALVIEKNDYDIFSVACFLYKYNNYPTIVEDLIKCNFDPLCHDNKDSKIYRLIMVLIFILKNSTVDITNNLKLMFPYYFLIDNTGTVTNTFNKEKITQLGNSTIVNEQSIFLPNIFLGLQHYINYIFQCLTEEQRNIFIILAGNDYEKIQDQLVYRLRNKSCYVFQVLNPNDKVSDKVIVNCFNDSAHKAFQTSKKTAENNANINRLDGRQLNPFLFTPRYTYCAIDAPLKNGVSLSGYNLIPFYSKVYLTAVTMNDAASQITPYSGKYKEPICIKIDVNNITTNNPPFTFTYKYEYGKSVSKKSEDIEIPEQIKNFEEEYTDHYKEIIEDLNNIKFKFYSGKKNVDPFKEELKRGVPLLLFIVGKIDSKIRDALSKLYENCIENVTKIPDEKAKFLSFFVDYISKKPSDSSSSSSSNDLNQKKQDLINYTYLFLELVKENEINILTDSINKFLHKNIDKFDEYNSQTVTAETGSSTKKRKKGIKGGDFEKIPKIGDDDKSISTIPFNYRIKTNVVDDDERVESDNLGERVESDNLGERVESDNLGEGVESDEPDELQYSYSTLFGNYGFDMAINEDGEYELHILDTEDQYNAYLRKYGLQGEDDTGVEQEAVGQQTQQQGVGAEGQTEVAEGGKRKKTKKHKRVKHNTRRVSKVRLNKSKRKVVRKATKTRSRK